MKEHEGFAFQDANWNVTSTTSFDAVVLDRVHTTPYGQPTFDAETVNGDYDADGDIDSSDDSSFTTCRNGTQPVTGACRTLDFDNDGDVDASDQTTFDTLYPGSTEIYRQPARSTSANGFSFAHQGLMIDEESNLYYNRHRQYNANQQRFVQRDPLAFVGDGFDSNTHHYGGLSQYQYAASKPIDALDPTGLLFFPPFGVTITCHCDDCPRVGDTQALVIVGPTLGDPAPGEGCITLPWPGSPGAVIFCSNLYGALLLSHECCHVCDLARGFAPYLGNVIPSPNGGDGCTGNEVDWSMDEPIGCPPQKQTCFLAETSVSTATGFMRIAAIRERDEILSVGATFGTATSHEVEVVESHELEIDLFRIGVNAESFVVTEGHCFLTPRGGWIQTERLSVGDQLQTLDGPVRIRYIHHLGKQRANVYNLKIGDSDNYIVGRSRIVVRDW